MSSPTLTLCNPTFDKFWLHPEYFAWESQTPGSYFAPLESLLPIIILNTRKTEAGKDLIECLLLLCLYSLFWFWMNQLLTSLTLINNRFTILESTHSLTCKVTFVGQINTVLNFDGPVPKEQQINRPNDLS